ncbi:MAG TPA: hypothetical protein VG328_13815 [Stellaceae bacterium]|nr:hypothetical protein [Stellaceae bacterium]
MPHRRGAAMAVIRTRYGVAPRYRTLVTVATGSQPIEVGIFDLPDRRRIYGWLEPSSRGVVLVEHRAGSSSPHEAVLAAAGV